MIEETGRCQQYIDERVLWIASAAPLGVADVRPANEAFWWLAGPTAWLDLGRTLATDAARNPALSMLAFCVFLLLLYWRLRFRARIQEIGEKAAQGNCYRFLPTLETAAVDRCWPPLVWPGLMCYVGWRLTVAAEASDLCRALGPGLTETARVFLALELLRQVCCPRGLGEVAFRLVGLGDEGAAAQPPLVQPAGAAADVRGGDHGVAGERSPGTPRWGGLFHGGAVVLLAGACTGCFGRAARCSRR